MRRRFSSRLALTVSLAALSLAASPSLAAASVSIGQLPNPVGSCSADSDRLQPTVLSGNSYVVPEAGGVTAWKMTSWSHNAAPGAGQTLTMKVFRKVAEPAAYVVVGHDGPRFLSPSTINTFPISMQVKSGDVLGSNGRALFSSSSACFVNSPGNTLFERTPGLADGEGAPFTTRPDSLLNIMAVLEPVNTFTLGAITRNKKKGTAGVAASVPNPGNLTVSGKGVKRAGGSGAGSAVGVTVAGTLQLLIRATGKKKRKLNKTGKVKLNMAITFTPTGGDPSTQSVKLKLKKKL
jgi:hypothetical protein